MHKNSCNHSLNLQMKGNIITPCTFLTDFGCKELKKELVII
jgi:hypothetical protein